MHRWLNWLSAIWPSLVQARQIQVPRWLPHPAVAGFRQTDLAESVGQVRNWTMWCQDGSRIHIHEFIDGTMVVHRDRINPEKSPAHAALHWLTEAPSGQLVLGVSIVATIAYLASRRR